MAIRPETNESALQEAVDRIAGRFHPDKIIREAVREGRVLYERAA